MCYQIVRGRSPTRRVLALALGANLLAVHIFGMTDAIALGTKVGLLFWLNLGLLSALHSVEWHARQNPRYL